MWYERIPVFRYRLLEDRSYLTGVRPAREVYLERDGETVALLERDGRLTVFAGFTWDGASGPAIDTENFMEASMAHDALYWMMRQGHLGLSWRRQADLLMFRLARRNGMSLPRACWTFAAVRLFGEVAAHLDGA